MVNAVDMIINVNDLKKGSKVILRNGWNATVEDNKKGSTRMCTVEGLCTEMGSVYATDIQFAIIDDKKLVVEYPDKYIKAMNARKAMGF